MSIRSTLYGKRVWMGGNPSSEQIAGALDLLQEDCTSETFQYHIGYWRTLRSDIVAKGLRKREKVETSERQQIRCTLPGGRSNPHRAENL